MAEEKSLKTLQFVLNQATDPNDEDEDTLAAKIFYTLIQEDPSLVERSTVMIVEKIKSSDVKEATKAIKLLQDCMAECGPNFQSKIAKHRFLNELIKLVARKFRGSETPEEVRIKIVECLALWTVQYPLEKIVSTYETLKNEVNTQKCLPGSSSAASQKHYPLWDQNSEEKFKKLIQSKNPDDVQKANLLVKFMLEQDQKKSETRLQINAELMRIDGKVKLLAEMLDTFEAETKKGGSVDADLKVTLKTLFDVCENSKLKIEYISKITEEHLDLIPEVYATSEILYAELERYKQLISDTENSPIVVEQRIDLTASRLPQQTDLLLTDVASNDLAALELVFGPNPEPTARQTQQNLDDDLLCLVNKDKRNGLDVNLLDTTSNESAISVELIKKNLEIVRKTAELQRSMKKDSAAIKCDNPTLSGIDEMKPATSQNSFDKLVGDVFNDFKKTKTTEIKDERKLNTEEKSPSQLIDDFSDRLTPDGSSEKNDDLIKSIPVITETKTVPVQAKSRHAIKPLSQISVEFTSVIPSQHKTSMEAYDKDGIKITFHFTANKPDEDVAVIVVSTLNNSSTSVKDFHFDAVPPKGCKVRVIPGTGNSLRELRPFQPPDCLNQILLIYDQTKKPVDIMCIIGFRREDEIDEQKDYFVVKNVESF